jgi:hypothetical protein
MIRYLGGSFQFTPGIQSHAYSSLFLRKPLDMKPKTLEQVGGDVFMIFVLSYPLS